MGIKNSLLSCSALLLVTSLNVHAQAGQSWVLDLNKGEGKVAFDAVGKPKMLKIHGEGTKPTGQMTVENGKVSGQASFDLNTLDTGIDLRNKHMKEKYLETAKHPKATFELVEIKLPNPLPKGDFQQDAPFKGKLTVKGVTKEVSGMAKLSKEGPKLTGKVEFGTTVKSYNIDLPSFAGITMADEVNVVVEFSGPMVQKGSARSVASKK